MILEWFSRFRPKSKEHSRNDAPSDRVFEVDTAGDAVGGFFANATDFAINGANMFDRSHAQVTQTIYNTINTGTAALDRLLPYTCPDAAADSSARHPPPRCHPGTRQRILDVLNNWLISHLWKIFWLSGPAGTGKSAVAQTFAEMCSKQGRLGAAYFFFRSSGRNDPRTVIPSLAYQLAVNVPHYGNLLGHAIARDPSIFQKTPRVQLQKLIVEPFTILQAKKPKITRKSFFIILDGLDECQGIEAQCEIVEMIGEVVRLKKDLPLLWLIASRPEPHLQYIFSRADFSINCTKEVLLIDADTRDDVNRYLRDSFIDMRTRLPPVTDVAWPSEEHLQSLEDIASGLFALAATIVRYVFDMEYGDPVGRLADFLAFMSGANHVVTTNPLQTLDLLYSQILSEIPKKIYPITKRILAVYCFHTFLSSVQSYCYFLRVDKHEFYNALSKLHSLLDIPSTATEGSVSAHHASFRDYLQSRFRSGRFFVDEAYNSDIHSQGCFFWYKTMLEDPCWVSDDSLLTVMKLAKNTLLPGLKLNSGHTLGESRLLRFWACLFLWYYLGRSAFHGMSPGDFEDFDFRYMAVDKSDNGFFSICAGWLFSLGPRNTLLHTEPQGQLEETLLETAVNEVDWQMEPAAFPMVNINDSESPYRYIFIGHGIRSCLFWFDQDRVLSGRCRLSCKVPLKETYAVSDCVIHHPEKLLHSDFF